MAHVELIQVNGAGWTNATLFTGEASKSLNALTKIITRDATQEFMAAHTLLAVKEVCWPLLIKVLLFVCIVFLVGWVIFGTLQGALVAGLWRVARDALKR